MFSFGDYNYSDNSETANMIEEYILKYWIPKFSEGDTLNQSFISKVYSKEIQGFKNIVKNVEDIQKNEIEYDLSFIPKEDLDEDMYIDNNKDHSDNEDSDHALLANQKIDTTIEDLKEERKSFYSSLEESMDQNEFEIFSKCRQQNFLIKGKEAFFNWIGIRCEQNYLKYFSHLVYNEVRVIVEYANKKLNKNHELHKLNKSLSVEQIDQSIHQRKQQIKDMILLRGQKLYIKEYITELENAEFSQKLLCNS